MTIDTLAAQHAQERAEERVRSYELCASAIERGEDPVRVLRPEPAYLADAMRALLAEIEAELKALPVEMDGDVPTFDTDQIYALLARWRGEGR